MTRNEFLLHDCLDYIDTATHKAALALEYVADYFDAEPIDHDRIRAEQATIRTLVNISLDYLTQIKREYTEAMSATAHTSDHADHTSTEASRTQTEPDTSTNTQPHKGHQRRTTTAPQTMEEALQRIHNINLNEVTGEIDGLYPRAIRQYLDDGKPWQLDTDWAIMTAYAIGVQEGRRRERQRRKRTTAPAT